MHALRERARLRPVMNRPAVAEAAGGEKPVIGTSEDSMGVLK
jgi:hypothetical protein